ncbi:NAD(P)/FAD-dependent oxidoreductase [Sphingomonas sp. NBWT7]|uniref:NAD(P)/FAD-dependent oxidoreductase n=1 Tax=Sphingomonas sp. NBWT7 TaxID=2596913 RepID=UPI002156547D|nr:FAD-dependent monooxygenase [Sphingomonas sp. NBWT7]
MSADTLIVGGGPAGAAAAITLANARAPHLLIERSRVVGDALCGGFLSWRSLDTLAALGLDPDALNRDRVTRVRLFAGTRMVEAPLPRPAIGVSRHRLDTLLMHRAVAAGARVERGLAVRAIDDGVRLDDGATLAPRALFLASGKHDVRGRARPAAARGEDPSLGLRVRLAPHPSLDRLVGDAIELHAFDRGYAGIVRQEDRSVNVCLALRRSRLHAAGSPAALLAELGDECPALGERLAFGFPAADAVANVPYGWRATAGEDGLFRLGDQSGVIPSLAGEGMGIALASGVSAAHAHLAGIGAADWQRAFARRLRRPIGIASLIRALAERPALSRIALPALGLVPAIPQMVAKATRIPPDPVRYGPAALEI